MIDALFGSKTRVKLLHLFFNNSGQAFYVREITRKVDEQINSVRRELSNMLEVGVITSDTADNKLYYQVNQRYDYYLPLKAIFAGEKFEPHATNETSEVAVDDLYGDLLRGINGLSVVVFAGVLVRGSHSAVDLLFVGSSAPAKIKAVVKSIEKAEGRDINYTTLTYEDFYYRLSMHDRFLGDILGSTHRVVIDKNNILGKE